MIPICTFAVTAILIAQSPSDKPAPSTNTVTGVVREKGSGQPFAHFKVSTMVPGRGSRTVESTTDDQGRYRLSGLPAGHYEITAEDSDRRIRQWFFKEVTLAGHDVEGINFDAMLDGAIEGLVLDENKDPVARVDVILVSREYFQSALGFYQVSLRGRTNDLGEYKIPNVEQGRPYLLYAETANMQIEGVAATPLNPALRRPVFRRTWYPGSTDGEGGTEVTVRPGEVTRGINIQMKKSPSYCAEGVTMVSGIANAANFQFEAQQPSTGTSRNGGVFGGGTNGKSDAKGSFRICGLVTGSYRLSASTGFGNSDPTFGAVLLRVGDEDLKDIKLNILPGASVQGEVILDGDPPAKPLTAKVAVGLLRLFGGGPGSFGGGTQADIPGAFTMPSVLPDDYVLNVGANGSGLYIKDATYGSKSVLYSPLQIAGPGPALRIVVGQDGGVIVASITDKNLTPVADATVVAVPSDVSSEAIFAEKILIGKTDQNGQYSSYPLAPGKYYVAATDSSTDTRADTIDKLWAAYQSFQKIDLAPNGKTQVTLELMHLNRVQ